MTTPPPADPPPAPANGAAWAALLSASLGAAAFGTLTVLSEASPACSRALQWVRPAGSLSGVAIAAVALWAALWAALHARWTGQHLRRERTLLVLTCSLATLAVVETFPLFYDLF